MADESPSEPAPEPSEPQKKKTVKVKAEPFDPAQEPARKTVDAPPPPPPPPQQPPPPPPPTEGASTNQPSGSTPKAASGRAWAMACHLTPLIDFGLTFLMYGFALPLILWLVKRDTDPEVDYHGKESLNFQLNLLFWHLLSIPLFLCGIGILIFLAVPVVKIVLCVVAAVKTAEGERYRYPFIYRVIQ